MNDDSGVYVFTGFVLGLIVMGFIWVLCNGTPDEPGSTPGDRLNNRLQAMQMYEDNLEPSEDK